MIFYTISLIFANLILILAFILGYRNRNVFEIEKRWFVVYIGFILGIEIIIKSCIYIFNYSDISFLYPIYIFGEFLILMKVFYSSLKIKQKWFLIPLFIAIIILSEGIYLWLNEQDVSMGYGKTISHLCIVFFAGFIMIRSLRKSDNGAKLAIIYTSLFLYYSISLIFFSLLHQLDTLSKFNAYIIWGMNNILSAFLYGASLYTFLIWKK